MIRVELPFVRYFLRALALTTVLTTASLSAADQQLSLDYAFQRPNVSQITLEGRLYNRIEMPNCPNGGEIGHPALPSCGAKILLPAGTAVERVTIVPGERIFLGNYLIEPIGPQFKLSEGPESVNPPRPNPSIYASEQSLPTSRFESIGTQSFRGFEILVLKLQPVEYIPATGALYYYTNLAVLVDLTETGQINPLYRGLTSDAREIRGKVDNPVTVESYAAELERDGRSSELLIITTPTLVSAFQPLADYHNANGLPTEIHTSTQVGGTNPDLMRTYIRNRYLLDGIDYVIIGGDDDVFPAKDLYVDYGSGSGGITNMPGDIYCACLDGTWNYDGDSRWGEPNDGEGGGPLDLIAEVHIGRAAVGDATEAARFVNKTIWYLNGSHPQPEKVLLCGEHLGFGGVSEYAGNTLEELIDGSSAHGYTTVGFPSDICSVNKLFDRDWPGHDWPASQLVSRINAGIHILNHLGHGDTNYAMKLYNNDVLSQLQNTQLCFVISQTCYAGHFDDADCWAETIHIKTNYGAFAVVMNARYGFGAYNSTDGASQRYNRQFWDAVYNESEAKPILGRALSDSKEDNLYRINESYMRWCYYEIHLFGDPTIPVMGVSGFTIAPDPDLLETCSPPENEAAFVINVGRLGDFAETVTLSASELPPGATATFSLNNQVPPFTAVMTVNSLIDVTPGSYSIVVAGDSASLHRAALASLRINDAAPTTTILNNPADGQSGVALLPELEWQAAAQAYQYELQIATDPNFSHVVYNATTSDTTHEVTQALDTLRRYYWRVRGANACGSGTWSAVFHFVTVNMVRPAAYDMLNGETGLYTYYDDSYNGSGNPGQALSPLSGGLGDLTDGLIATQNWRTDHQLYVGWKTIDPTITFHFAGTVAIDRVILHVDDSNGDGGVNPPQDVRISMGGVTFDFHVTNPPGSAPCALEFGDLGLAGDTMQVTIYDHTTVSSYMMLSEVEFYSDDTPCVGDLDGDQDIDIADLAVLLSNYGLSGATYEQGDLDGDGIVAIGDLALLLSVYGTTCP